jgi:hypothetical protein
MLSAVHVRLEPAGLDDTLRLSDRVQAISAPCSRLPTSFKRESARVPCFRAIRRVARPGEGAGGILVARDQRLHDECRAFRERDRRRSRFWSPSRARVHEHAPALGEPGAPRRVRRSCVHS